MIHIRCVWMFPVFETKYSVQQRGTLQNLYRSKERSKISNASLKVNKFSFHLLAIIRNAFLNQSIVNSKADVVAFKA